MKRDMDLVRAILLAVESHQDGYAPSDLKVDGYTEDQVAYHCYLLGQSGLVEAIDTAHMGSTSPTASIRTLTWAGYDFLEASREPSIWQQAKEVVDRVGGASLTIWTAVLTDLVRRNLGL
jgi:hypothetical protein